MKPKTPVEVKIIEHHHRFIFTYYDMVDIFMLIGGLTLLIKWILT